MQAGNIVSILLIALAVFIVIKILTAPIKLGLKFLLNALSGFALLFICNAIGGMIGIAIPVTWITASVAGFFGLPGVAVLLLLQLFL